MMHLRKSYEITGYADTENGVVYCLDCHKEWLEQQACGLQPHNDELTPIFLGDEWDAPGPSCDNCHALIEINPIVYEKKILCPLCKKEKTLVPINISITVKYTNFKSDITLLSKIVCIKCSNKIIQHYKENYYKEEN